VNGMMGRAGFAEKKVEIGEWKKKKQRRYVG